MNLNLIIVFLILKVCELSNKGSFGIFKSNNLNSKNAIQTLSEYYQVSLVTWSSVAHSDHMSEINFVKKNHTKSKRSSKYRSFADLVKIVQRTNFTGSSNVIFFDKRTKVKRMPLYFLPNLSNIMIKLLKDYDWNIMYFIYNHGNAKHLIDPLLNAGNSIGNIIIRRVTNIQNIEKMLK